MRCGFCKGSGCGCGNPGDCPYCAGGGFKPVGRGIRKDFLGDAIKRAIQELQKKGAQNIRQTGPRELQADMRGYRYTYTVDPYEVYGLLQFEIKHPL